VYAYFIFRGYFRCKDKGQDKDVPAHPMRANEGMEIVRNAIELWYWMDISHKRHAPTTLPLGKTPPYPVNMSLGKPRGWYGHFGEEKKLFFLPSLQPSGCTDNAIHTCSHSV
jgi:hypothetical protein